MHIVRGADAEDVLRRGRCTNGIVGRPRITSGYVDEEVVMVVGKLKAIRNMAFSGVRVRATLQSKSAPLSKVMLIKYRNYLVHVQGIGIVPCVCCSPADRMDPDPAPCKSIVASDRKDHRACNKHLAPTPYACGNRSVFRSAGIRRFDPSTDTSSNVSFALGAMPSKSGAGAATVDPAAAPKAMPQTWVPCPSNVSPTLVSEK